MTDDPAQADLDDARIEDTVHCSWCGAPWVLGGSGDGVTMDLPDGHPGTTVLGPQLKLCMDCAAFVSRTYHAEANGEDQCAHGVLSGQWCQSCHQTYRETYG